MKNQFIFPAIAALIGFSAAWALKPSAPAPVASGSIVDAEPKKNTRPTAPDTHPSSAAGKRPTEVKATDFPLVDLAEKGPQNREEAKMLRLTEALGLTIDQQGEIIRLVEESHNSVNPNLSVVEDLAARGKVIEDAIGKLLSPEQLVKFNEIRVRERDNQIESRAQHELTKVIEEVDLSPEQRDQVIERLRQSSKAELQAIPAAATLLFEKSVLPTGKTEISVDGILLLAKMGEPIDATDPIAAHKKVLQTQRQNLEEKLKCYDGILTPAQMGQYYAAAAEQNAILDRTAAAMNPNSQAGAPPPPPITDVKRTEVPATEDSDTEPDTDEN